MLGARWLEPPESPADLNGDDSVDFIDYVAVASQWSEAGIPLAINECMASNPDTPAKRQYAYYNSWRDPQGEFEDWIEIYNFGDEPIDVRGMYMTDDPTEPQMWRIEPDTSTQTVIQPGDYLIIWADDETSDSGLHAGFHLAADGDEIAMFAADGKTLIDAIHFPEQTADISYGRYPDANESLRFLSLPSPGAVNQGAYLGEVAEVQFSKERGLCDEPFTVTLSTETDDARIYYTRDGSEPYDLSERPPKGLRYTGPITIDRTTCIRAKAVKYGYKPSKHVTHTYIFLDQVLEQPDNPPGFPQSWIDRPSDYAMDARIVNDPVYGPKVKDALVTHRIMSLSLDQKHLWNAETGIYVNPGQEGVAWERPVSMEIIDPNGGKEIQVNAGLRIQGSASRSLSRSKHNMRLLFKSMYGPSKLEFPMFEDWPVERFDTIILRGGNGDSWIHPNVSQQIRAQYIRDQYPRDMQVAMGRITAGQGYIHLYINGLYWGLYHTIERPNASFWAEHLGGRKEDWDVVQHKNGTVDGNRNTWNIMMQIANSGLGSEQAYEDIARYVDIDNLIDYMIVNFYIGNTDWDHNNWYGARRRSPQGRFRFCNWDSERTFLRANDNVTGKNNNNQPTHVHQQLTANSEYRLRFADAVHKHLFNGGLLTPQAAADRWMAWADRIRLALVAESARWGDNKRPANPYTPDVEWQAELDWFMNTYFPGRTTTVLQQLKGRNLYPAIQAPVYSRHGGIVEPGFALSMTAQQGDIWYTKDGSDPRAPGESTPKTDILVEETAGKRVVVPTASIDQAWTGKDDFDDSSWLGVFGEPGGVGFDRDGDYNDLLSTDLVDQMYGINASCYVRIPFVIDEVNPSNYNSLSLYIRYDDGYVAYINGVPVARANAPGSPAWNSQSLAGHPDTAAVEPEFVDVSAYIYALRPGDNILAIHAMNRSTTSDDVLVTARLTVSTVPSVTGVSPTAFKYDQPVVLNETTCVKARTLNNGDWSALNEAVFAVGPVAENLRISEIMYRPEDTGDPNDPNAEFVELTNVGSETISLNLVKFTDGIDFTFPKMNLAAGDYVVVAKHRKAFETRYGTQLNVAGYYDGRLSNGGERITLADAAGREIVNFRYKDGWYDMTDGEGFSLTLRNPTSKDLSLYDRKEGWRPSALVGGSPGWDDSGFVPEPGSVVINEVLAHSHAAAADWIELHNTTEKVINIGGWYLSDSDADDPNRMKYRIPDGTRIEPNDYIVFYEYSHFGGPDADEPFALSENGDAVVLSSAQDDALAGYRDREDFDASPTGIAFGRYRKAVEGTFNFVLMSENTPGSANAYPLVGPVVVNEIMYNPLSGDQDREYIELLNITDSPVTLYDYATGDPWKFTDGIELIFGGNPPVTIPANGLLLLVKDDAEFVSQYGAAPPGVQVLQWHSGNLSNGGEKLEISMPGDVDKFGVRRYIRIDRINFSDGSHPEGQDPWPSSPDGGGTSLGRVAPWLYGNEAANWQPIPPSPGLR